MSTEKILGRVRKMLAMANDAACNEGERDNALRMAYATLAKHNLNIKDVGDDADTAAAEARVQQVTDLSVYPWARSLGGSIADLFFCEFLFARRAGKKAAYYFIGRTSNAVTALEMTRFVQGSVFKEVRSRYGADTSPEARAFATGVAQTISRRCYELRRAAEQSSADGSMGAQQPAGSASRALVLVDVYKSEEAANKAFIAELFGKIKTSTTRTKYAGGAAFRAGREHGETIPLNPMLGKDKEKARSQ